MNGKRENPSSGGTCTWDKASREEQGTKEKPKGAIVRQVLSYGSCNKIIAFITCASSKSASCWLSLSSPRKRPLTHDPSTNKELMKQNCISSGKKKTYRRTSFRACKSSISHQCLLNCRSFGQRLALAKVQGSSTKLTDINKDCQSHPCTVQVLRDCCLAILFLVDNATWLTADCKKHGTCRNK